MKPFKFFQNKPERVFTDYMDRMDDYFLGGIRQPTPNDVEYYHTEGFEFVDVSPIHYSPETFVPQKYMMFRSRTGEILQGNLIGPDHPMYNFPDII